MTITITRHLIAAACLLAGLAVAGPSAAQQSATHPTADTLIAIDVLLLPDQTMTARANAINARLGAVGYQGPPLTTGLYPNPVHNMNFLGKVDHQFSSNDQFSVIGESSVQR